MPIAGASPTSGDLQRVRTERVIAAGRAFLTVAGLLAIYLDPTEPRRLQAVTYTVLAAYAIYGVSVYALMRATSTLTVVQVRIFHSIDILLTSVLTFVSEGPVSPFFLFFLFSLLSSAFRWTFRETLATAVVVVSVFLLETALAAVGPWHHLFVSSEGELNRIMLRAAYLLITGVLLSYLAEQDKSARAELAAVAAVARQPRIASGLGQSIDTFALYLLSLFGAQRIVTVIHDPESGRTARFVTTTPETASAAATEESTLEGDSAWLFADGGSSWFASTQADGRVVVRGSVADQWPLRRRPVEVPAAVLGDCRAASGVSIAAANMGFDTEWQGRIYVVGPARRFSPERAVHLLESLVDHAAPGLTNVFLMRRLRVRAGADERARVARELHDGAIQALYGLDMKIEALRRSGHRDHLELDSTLAEVQVAVRHEVLALRDLMQALRPIEIDGAQQLQEVVSALVERFRRDTGISARFIANGSHITLPPATTIELVRIIQEALVNVRKHSRGQNVLVRIDGLATGGCRLLIEDDGQGFEFEGRLTAADLDQRRIGPAIIKERARIAKADLVIESAQGQGARLELLFEVAA